MSAVPHWFVAFTRATLSILAAVVGFTLTAGVITPISVSLAIGAAAGAAAFMLLRASPYALAASANVPPRLRTAFAIGATVLIVQLLLAAAFVIDPTLATWQGRPWTPQRSDHSCVSSYWVACDRIREVRDIYAEEIYSVPQANPSTPRVGRRIGPLIIDQYEYPPAFLLLPRLIAAGTADFWGFRRVWFALNLAVVALGVILVARRFDRALSTHALWLTPFVLIPPSIMITFVMGNVQLAIIAVSMIAMLLFERTRHASGGALLAYAVVGKLYPGVLVLYLLLRRDWRAVAWTTAFSLTFVLISLLDVGLEPYLAFAAHMPRLLSGEAFPAFRNPTAIAINESIPGLVFKLQLFGVPFMGFAASKALGWIYTMVVLGITARLALRPSAAGREPLAWITILILATMRSPFLPTYAPFPSLWLATLLAALTWGQSRTFASVVAAWVVLAFTFGTGGAPPAVNAVWTFIHTVAAFVLVGIAVRMAAARRDAAVPVPDAVAIGGRRFL
jgi:hypothetical protein